MLPIILGLLTSIFTAISRVLLKKGFVKSTPLTGMFISLVICCFMLVLMTLLTVPFEIYNLKGICFFAFIGFFAPPVVRYLTYIGIDKVGASRAAPIRSLTPFFAIIIAITFLKEPFNLLIIIGAALIVSGAIILSRKSSAHKSNWNKKYLLIPLAAAFLAGIAANLRKYGFTIISSPFLAAASTAVAALIVFSIYVVLSGKKDMFVFDKDSLRLFGLSSMCTSTSIILNLSALKYGKVSVVSPLLATSPLFVILFSHIFLKKQELVTLNTILGGILIFIGIEVFIIFR